jgi:hypothetical protein
MQLNFSKNGEIRHEYAGWRLLICCAMVMVAVAHLYINVRENEKTEAW